MRSRCVRSSDAEARHAHDRRGDGWIGVGGKRPGPGGTVRRDAGAGRRLEKCPERDGRLAGGSGGARGSARIHRLSAGHASRQAVAAGDLGNGACRDNGLQYTQFLREVASHGYYIISLGYARNERAVEKGLKIPANLPPPTRVDDETHVEQMYAALDWAARPPADLKGHIDTSKVAVMGHSCGGLQSIAASADPRIATTLIFDSGVYNKPLPTNRSGIQVAKSDLAKIHGPIAYFIGGPTDIAYENAMDDFARLRGTRFLGQLPIGHMGTFWEDANGGEWGRAASAWLDWQLKGDQAKAAMFRGTDCGLCKSPPWSVDNSKL